MLGRDGLGSYYAASNLNPGYYLQLAAINDRVGALLLNSYGQPGGQNSATSRSRDLPWPGCRFRRLVVPSAFGGTRLILRAKAMSTSGLDRACRRLRLFTGQQVAGMGLCRWIPDPP